MTASASYAQAMQAMNQKNYEEAVVALEKVVAEYPNSPEAKRRLMHAYAGAAGFESMKFRNQIEDVKKRLESSEFKSSLSELEEFQRQHSSVSRIDLSLLRKLRKVTVSRRLKELFSSIPTLSPRQTERLAQALRMYKDLGLSPKTSSKEDNFKWGVLFSYRILVNLKLQFDSLDKTVSQSSKAGWESHKELTLKSSKQIIEDAKFAYTLFKYSYTKLSKITDAIDKFLKKATNGRFHGEMIVEAKSVGELLSRFMLENRDLTADFTATIEEKFENSGLAQMAEEIFDRVKNESPEYEYRKDRIRAIVRKSIDLMNQEHSKEIDGAVLISKKVWSELEPYLNSIEEEGSFDEIKKLLRDHRSELNYLKRLAKDLLDEERMVDLHAQLRPQLEALREMVDREQVIIFLEKARLLEAESKALGNQYLYLLRPQLKLLEKQLKAKGKNIEDLLDESLGQEWRSLKRAIESENMQDEAKMNRGSKEVDDYLGKDQIN